jgi:hypothetical protein
MFAQGLIVLLSAGLARAAVASPGIPSAARFEADLARRLLRNPTGATFSVTSFGFGPDASGGVDLSAEVRLDWSPGFRVRRFASSARGAEDAYEALHAAACREFTGVVPGFAALDRVA